MVKVNRKDHYRCRYFTFIVGARCILYAYLSQPHELEELAFLIKYDIDKNHKYAPTENMTCCQYLQSSKFKYLLDDLVREYQTAPHTHKASCKSFIEYTKK